jgi:hypothetical protein
MKQLKIMLTLFWTASLIVACSYIDQMEIADVFSVETIYVEEPAPGGYWVYFLNNGVITSQIFLQNGNDGVDGIDGLNGIDGIDGQDGASITMSSEETEGGTMLSFYLGDVLVSQFIVPDGQDGVDGVDGINGIDGCNYE